MARPWGPALVLPDDVADRNEAGPVSKHDSPSVLVAGSFDSNEPVAEAIAASALMPEFAMRFTGDPAELPSRLKGSAPANVAFTGYLPYGQFLGEMLAADVVAVFSTDPYIMNRAAFEAVGLGKPLVLSDLPGLRSRFGPAAVFCRNEPAAMADALRRAQQEKLVLAQRSQRLATRLRSEREESLARFISILSSTDKGPKSRRKRVLVISSYPFPDQVVQRNVSHLLKSGARVDVICSMESHLARRGMRTPRGLRVFRVPVRHRRSSALSYVVEYLAFVLIAFTLASVLGIFQRYDAAEVINMPDVCAFCALVPKKRGTRVVLNMLELNPELTAARLCLESSSLLVRLQTWFEGLATSWVDHVSVVNESCRRILIQRGVESDKVSVVPNTPAMTPTIISGRRQLPAKPVTLITHGTLLERYGIQTAIEAVSELKDEWKDLTLELVGEGEYGANLAKMAARLGIEERVHFRGFLPWAEALERVRLADVGLVTVTDDGYGHLLLPTRLLDYVCCEIPAICSRLPTIQDYFPADTVTYVVPGNASDLASKIDQLLRNPEAMKKQAKLAQRALERLSWNVVSTDYMRILGMAQ